MLRLYIKRLVAQKEFGSPGLVALNTYDNLFILLTRELQRLCADS